MVTNQKPSGRAASMPMGLLIGLTVSMGITVLLTAICAKLVDMQQIDVKNIGYCAMVILMIAPFCGAKTAQKRIKHQNLMVAAMSGGLYFLTLIGITILFFGGQFEAVGVTLLLIVGGVGLTLLTGGGKNNSGKHRNKKRHNR